MSATIKIALLLWSVSVLVWIMMLVLVRTLATVLVAVLEALLALVLWCWKRTWHWCCSKRLLVKESISFQFTTLCKRLSEARGWSSGPSRSLTPIRSQPTPSRRATQQPSPAWVQSSTRSFCSCRTHLPSEPWELRRYGNSNKLGSYTSLLLNILAFRETKCRSMSLDSYLVYELADYR